MLVHLFVELKTDSFLVQCFVSLDVYYNVLVSQLSPDGIVEDTEDCPYCSNLLFTH